VVQPIDTPEAQSNKLKGNVLLKLTIGENGQVTKVSIVRPLGLGLDDRAARAVKKWKFKPATYKGKPVTIPYFVKIGF